MFRAPKEPRVTACSIIGFGPGAGGPGHFSYRMASKKKTSKLLTVSEPRGHIQHERLYHSIYWYSPICGFSTFSGRVSTINKMVNWHDPVLLLKEFSASRSLCVS